LFLDDPGAFEQYAKSLLWIGRGISTIAAKNAGFAVTTLPWGVFGLNFQASLDSLGSVDPLANQTDQGGGLGAFFFNAAAPKFGPVVTIPAKVLQQQLMERGDVGAADTLNKVLGPVGQSLPLWTMFVPNSFLQHVIEGSAGYAGIDQQLPGGLGSLGASYVSAQDSAAEVYFTDMFRQAYNRTDGLKPQYGLTEFQTRMNAAVTDLIQKWQDPNFQSHVAQNIQHQAAILWMLKTGGSFVSPASLSIGQAFPQLQATYQATIKKHNGNIIAADDEFLKKYPWATALTVAHSGSNFGTSFGSSVGSAEWASQQRYMVHNYPTAAALFVPPNVRAQPYNQWAEQMLQLLGMRHIMPLEEISKGQPSRDSYLGSLEWSMGESWLYNVFYPSYDAKVQKEGYSYNLYQQYFGDKGQFKYGGSTPSILSNFAHLAPTWYSMYEQNATHVPRNNALDDIQKMYNDPHYWGDSTTDKTVAVMYYLSELSQTIPKYEAGGGYDSTVNEWNKILDQAQKGNFSTLYSAGLKQIPPSQQKEVGNLLTYAIETIFRPIAPKFSSTGGSNG
jgi:hypothetical protein